MYTSTIILLFTTDSTKLSTVPHAWTMYRCMCLKYINGLCCKFIAGQRPCPGAQPPCASTQQPTLIALVPQPCNQALLQANTQQAVCPQALSDTRLIASSTGSLNSIITPCQQQNLMRPSSTEDYSYPNLRLQLQDYNNQQHVSDDGYVIVQPDQCVQGNTQVEENVCTDVENCGPRGAMDDTL